MNKIIYIVCINDGTEEAYSTRELADIGMRKWRKTLNEPIEDKDGTYTRYYVHIHEVPLIK